MWKKSLILVFAVLAVNSIATAQKVPRKIEITGAVLDVYDGPIANAIIMVDGQKTNTLTDPRGNYKIKVSSKAARIGAFTFGNGLITDSIKGRDHINFSFNTIASQLEDGQYFWAGQEGVNNGYGVVKRRDLTTDITKIDGANRKYSTYSSIYDMIQREVSGVQVTGHDIIIQGSRNFDGFVRPLVVVDGVYMKSVPNIPPTTVKSIEVLKSTASAIYGSRAYGGVIIIKTKLEND